VDEKFHGRWVATAFSEELKRLAKERELRGYTAEVLQANKKIMKMLVVISTSPLSNGNHWARCMQNDVLSRGAE
jgi:hypothetical protein